MIWSSSSRAFSIKKFRNLAISDRRATWISFCCRFFLFTALLGWKPGCQMIETLAKSYAWVASMYLLYSWTSEVSRPRDVCAGLYWDEIKERKSLIFRCRRWCLPQDSELLVRLSQSNIGLAWGFLRENIKAPSLRFVSHSWGLVVVMFNGDEHDCLLNPGGQASLRTCFETGLNV